MNKRMKETRETSKNAEGMKNRTNNMLEEGKDLKEQGRK